MPPTAAPPRSYADTSAMLGMTVFLGTWVMLFAALFLAYGVVRVQADAWPPPNAPRLPLGWPGVATLVLLASSLTLRRGQAAARAGDRRRLERGLAFTLLAGVVFLALQALGWRVLLAAGLRPESGVYGSVFFAFTIFHALHVVCGLVVLAVALVRLARRRAPPPLTMIRLTAAFWDFVAVVWVLMYLTVYVW